MEREKAFERVKDLLLDRYFTPRIVKDLKTIKQIPKIEIPKDKNGLYLYGPVGSGKTILAASVMWGMIRQDYLSWRFRKYEFVTVPELLIRIRNSFSDKATETEQDVLSYYSDVDVLVLDDLGVEKVTEWVFTTLYMIINKRFENLRFTIVTSNYSLPDLQSKLDDARIVSRLISMCKVVRLDGFDKRVRSRNGIVS